MKKKICMTFLFIDYHVIQIWITHDAQLFIYRNLFADLQGGPKLIGRECMNEKEQETLEFLLAQALFSAEVPFAFVENPLIIQFFNYLRPSFKLPNRKKIANELLDEVYEEVKIQADKQISKATILYMISDGWSNINRKSVQNFVICIPKPFFFDATFSDEESHIAEWVANQITQQMDIISIQKFSAVITDIASIMKAA